MTTLCEHCYSVIESDEPRMLNRAYFADHDGIATVDRYFHPACAFAFVAEHPEQFAS